MEAGRLEHAILNHEHTLYRTALAILADVGEAQDAVQDTFVTYMEKAPVFESAAHEKAWLIRVTVNGCKSILRSPWRRRVPLLDTYPARTEEEGSVMELVLSLPPKDRATVHLFYYEGYQTGEIAAMTGEREGTVRSRLSRARGKLRAMLEGENP